MKAIEVARLVFLLTIFTSHLTGSQIKKNRNALLYKKAALTRQVNDKL